MFIVLTELMTPWKKLGSTEKKQESWGKRTMGKMYKPGDLGSIASTHTKSWGDCSCL